MATPLPRSPSTARRSTGRLRFSFLPFSSRLALLALSSSLLLCFHMVFAAEGIASRTKTVAGHNLDPTPWHLFPHVKQQLRSIAAFRCHFLSCPRRRIPPPTMPKPRRPCPSFFRWIHRDLQPWRRSRISPAMAAEAGRHGAMRVVNLEGKRLFVDLYYACVQSRAMFTIWGLLQLLRRCPGVVPDVELMFDCMDRPSVNRSEYCPDNGGADGSHLPPPPPLFRYCTTRDHLDIPFPDWSFWGWPEINIKPWDEEFQNIKLGSQTMKWRKRARTAYWKGNPDVQSPVREALLSCNDSKMWGAQIMHQDWIEESRSGFQKSSLSNQCSHRYIIYAEGYAWSVSLKYIMACGSLALIIEPQNEDFFSRGLVPKENYWPISPTDLCPSIKFAVEWGNRNPSKAEAIGKKGQAFMQELNLDQVYDYMYHLIAGFQASSSVVGSRGLRGVHSLRCRQAAKRVA
ncbi:unnamed protein product [Musa textilis]